MLLLPGTATTITTNSKGRSLRLFSSSSSSEYFAVIDEMKVTELKEHLRRLKKPVSGTKALLQERLKEALIETPVQLTSVSAVPAAAAVADDGEEQLLPPSGGEENEDEADDGYGQEQSAAPRGRAARPAATRGYGDDDEAQYQRGDNSRGSSGYNYRNEGRGGGGRYTEGGNTWRADEEEWVPATEDEVELGQEMEAEVMSFSDLGITVRLDGKYRGLIYEDELDYQTQRKGLRVGDRCPVYVQKVRRDGKVDASFRKFGTFPKLQDGRQVVLDALLASRDGSLPLGDKSNSEEVVATLGISKSQFKAAVGMLYKERQLAAPEGFRISLLPEGERSEEVGSSAEEEEGEEGVERNQKAFSVRAEGGEGGREGGWAEGGGWDAKREEAKWAPTKVFIRGLPFSLTEEDVEKMMGKIGPLVGIRGMIRRDDGRPSGVAWVEYEDEADAVTAKSVFNGKTFRGRYLEVFNMEEMRSDQHRRGGGGGGGGYNKRGGDGGGGGYDRRGGRGGGGYESRGGGGGGGDWKTGGGQRRDFSSGRGGGGGGRYGGGREAEGEDSWGEVGGWRNSGAGEAAAVANGEGGGYFNPKKEGGLSFDADLDFGDDE